MARRHRTAEPDRVPLLTALSAMHEEAFGWFVAWAAGGMVQYPDALGGFSPASRQGIEALRTAARAYMDAGASKSTKP